MSAKLPTLPEVCPMGVAISLKIVEDGGGPQTFRSRIEAVLPDRRVVGMPMRAGVAGEAATYVLPTQAEYIRRTTSRIR